MKLEIINEPFRVNIYGFSGTVINSDYAGTAFPLMNRMWQVVKANDLTNKGLNIWVYEQDNRMFAGVELDNVPTEDVGLEQKDVCLTKYAHYKHIGPYHLIKQAVQQMMAALQHQGYKTTLPYIEIYGHWSNDETKLETELLMSLQ